MKLGGVRQSSNIEDRRGGGGGGGRRGGGPKIALSGGVVVVIVIVGAIMGKDPSEIIRDVDRANTQAQSAQGRNRSAPSNETAAANASDPSRIFVSKVLATTEDAWAEQFSKHGAGRAYAPPKLVVFRDEVASACGYQSAAVGPFYCPPDRKAFLDLTFFDEMAAKLGAPGDFAQAYVVAHEIGHHIQTIAPASNAPRGSARHEKGADGNAVRAELQADCYAGVWGAYAKKHGILDVDDVDEALRAAQQIGDDTLQKRARGRVSPESFSHGTAAQRARWFKHGMTTADMRACDTFGAKAL
jgi:predicted metalloprotease